MYNKKYSFTSCCLNFDCTKNGNTAKYIGPTIYKNQKNDKRTYVRFPYIYNTTLKTDPKKNENSSNSPQIHF